MQNGLQQSQSLMENAGVFYEHEFQYKKMNKKRKPVQN